MGAGASVDEGVTVDGELAKVLSASDNDLAAAADKLNRDIKRMVPKTASGRLDAASIKEDERESVLEVLGRARRLAELGFAASRYHSRADGSERGKARTRGVPRLEAEACVILWREQDGRRPLPIAQDVEEAL